MLRGAWHQCGDKSQKLVVEQFEHKVGVGVIISPRDVARRKAIEYARAYHALGAHVLIDQQFYEPKFSNSNLASYPISPYRAKVSQPDQLADSDLAGLADALHIVNREISADGLIAPAVVYQAERPDIVQLNARLLAVAKRVGDELGIPTYATTIFGRSCTSSDSTMSAILSRVTALNCDGWYYGFEFGQERIPTSREGVLRCCVSGLTLACTGKPVLHAYAGPMALLSLGFGATGTAVGHSQNLWKFTPTRWYPRTGEGGGGGAPPRFFSSKLWGTIIYPDEVIKLPADLRNQVLTNSPFSTSVSLSQPFAPWTRWNASKHLVHIIGSAIANVTACDEPRANAGAAISVLEEATALHGSIAAGGLVLADNTNAYQRNWQLAMTDLLNTHSKDFDYLALLR